MDVTLIVVIDALKLGVVVGCNSLKRLVAAVLMACGRPLLLVQVDNISLSCWLDNCLGDAMRRGGDVGLKMGPTRSGSG